MTSVIYTGQVGHERIAPVNHRFAYPLFFAGADVDELGDLDTGVAGFGYNRFGPLALHDKDFLRQDGQSLPEKLIEFMPERTAEDRVLLVTAFRYWGRLFSPVSFYLRLREGVVQSVLAEVNNTFHDRHVYHLPSLQPEGDFLTARHAKEFHVSPFNDREGTYVFRFNRQPLEHLDIGVNLERDGKTVFRSWLSGRPRPFTSREIRRVLLRHPVAAAVTMPRILTQAAHLYFRKKLKVFKRPEPDHPGTILTRGK